MLKECLEVFEQELENKPTLILDTYVPDLGMYIILKPKSDSFEVKEVLEIKKNEKGSVKTASFYNLLCFYDYHSKLISMDKPMGLGNQKLIHSNNYLSFFVKQVNLTNGKLTDDFIDSYYNALSNPWLKYKNPKQKEVYGSVEKELGSVDLSMIEKVRKWIKDNIFSLEQQNISISGKEYLKLFFEYPNSDETRRMIEREGKRYQIPNLYNNNDFNICVDGIIYGLPNDNMGMNSKKPYLKSKSRKTELPCLLNNKEAFLRKNFFDYLLNCVSSGLVNIYLNQDNKTIIALKNNKMPESEFHGIYLRIEKAKDVVIQNQDVISEYHYKLERIFQFNNLLQLKLNDPNVSEQEYGVCDNIEKIQRIIDSVFFSKQLISNYFVDAGEIRIKDAILKRNLLIAREHIFDWVYKGNGNGISELLNRISLSFVISAVYDNNFILAKHRFNLRWSLNNYFGKVINMEELMKKITEDLDRKINSEEEQIFESEEEYYYAIGQLTNYLLSLTKQKEPTHARINPILNSKNEEALKSNLLMLFKKYNYIIHSYNKRFNKLYSMIEAYHGDGKVNQDFIIAGYLSNNLIYKKTEEEKTNE